MSYIRAVFEQFLELLRALIKPLLGDESPQPRKDDKPPQEPEDHPPKGPEEEPEREPKGAGEEIPRQEDNLEETEIISPPIIVGTLYACAESIILRGFIPHADIEIEIDGSVKVSETAGVPEPGGQAFKLPDPLVASQVVRARQHFDGMTSDWTQPITVRDHTEDYPAGPPRPVIAPAPVYECGLRTGVRNLLPGSTVWVTADSVERGRVNGGKEHQGVNVNPAYSQGQHVQAWSSLCDDPSPPSPTEIAQPSPEDLPQPEIDEGYDGQDTIIIRNLANGCQVTLTINGSTFGTARCWGGSLEWHLGRTLNQGEQLSATQRLCEVESPPGTTEINPCSDLPAPKVEQFQVGDTRIYLMRHVPGARIKVYINGVKVGDGGGAVIQLTQPIRPDDTVYVLQIVNGCIGQTVRRVEAECVAPQVTGDPSYFNLFPVGYAQYASSDTFDFTELVDADGDGIVEETSFSHPIQGTVYYPAETDGENTPFNLRLSELRAPIVFIAHGRHGKYRPAENPLIVEEQDGVVVRERELSDCSEDPGDVIISNYEGYDYLQRQLARMGIIAVSIDQSDLNCYQISGGTDIRRRGELIVANIDYFKTLHDDSGSIFHNRIDFSRFGLLGHSRGGEGVLRAAEIIPSYVTLQGVLSLAPVNFGVSSGEPTGFEFMVIAPAADGDVVELDGLTFYDQARPRTFRSQVYLHYGCHNYFNRQWLADDGIPYGRQGNRHLVTRRHHERVLSAYGCAFFRSTLLEHTAMLKYLTGEELPARVPNEHVHLSFEWNDDRRLIVDNHEDPNDIHKNSLHQPTDQHNLAAFEQAFTKSAGGNEKFFGDTNGMIIRVDEQNGVFRSSLGQPRDLTDAEVWVRVAEVRSGDNHFTQFPNSLGFQLGLEDDKCVAVWVDTDCIGGLARLFNRVDEIFSDWGAWLGSKTLLNTMRFPSSCFLKQEREWARQECEDEANGASPPELDITRIVAILIRYNRQDERLLALDDLQIVRRKA